MVDEKIVVETLKERRRYIYELAAEIGIPETRLRRLLKGRTQPREGEPQKIADALALPLHALLVEPAVSRRATMHR